MGVIKLNQAELAQRIDKPYKTVNNWFNKRNITPKTEDAVKIAKALNTTVEYLVTGVKQGGWKPPQRYADIVEKLDLLDDRDLAAVRTLAQGLATQARTAKPMLL